jgi:hypothetical protein
MRFFRELTDNQIRMLADTRQLYEAYTHARELRAKFTGGMTWRNKNGTNYLTKIIDSHGGQRSLGAESDVTKKQYDDFVKGKAASIERLKSIKARLDEQSRFNRAAQLGRVPRIAADILRKLADHRLLGRGVTVVGTNALYAYESEAAVIFDRDQTSTSDIDLLWDVRQRLQLTTEMAEEGVIGLLKAVDSSFSKNKPYRAINSEGYFVDLIRPTSTPRGIEDGIKSIGGGDDLEAAEIEGLWWLRNVPALSTVGVGDDGHPVPIVAPHPLAYSAHKMWLSRRLDRDPGKKRRDAAQSDLVATLVREYLPMWRYNEQLLQALPLQLRVLVDGNQTARYWP